MFVIDPVVFVTKDALELIKVDALLVSVSKLLIEFYQFFSTDEAILSMEIFQEFWKRNLI
jgi:hypothetical protein